MENNEKSTERKNATIVDIETSGLNPSTEPIITIKEYDIKDDPNYEKYKSEISSDFSEDSQEFKSLFLLHKHLTETPQEELDKEFAEIEAMGFEGPTVEEYFQGINPQFQRQKGYSEGAKMLMEKVINRLSEDERPLVPTAEIIALIRFIYENE